MAVDPDRTSDERIEGHYVVDHEGDPLVSGLDVAELPGVEDGTAGTSDPEERPVEFEREGNHIGLLVGAKSREPRNWL